MEERRTAAKDGSRTRRDRVTGRTAGRTIVLRLAGVCAIATGLLLASGCSDNGSGPADLPLQGGSRLQACSGHGRLLLRWSASPDETRSNFQGYQLRVTAANGSRDTLLSLPRGTRSAVVSRLVNGTVYRAVLHAVASTGRRSDDSAVIEWAPAERLTHFSDGRRLSLGPTLAGSVAGLDLRNDSGRAEELDLASAAFRTRGDVFGYVANLAAPFEVVRADYYAANPGRSVEFVPLWEDVDSLDGWFSSGPPPANAYTAPSIAVAGWSQTGRLYWGRVRTPQGWQYFRLLVRRSPEGMLLHGLGIEQRLVFELSYQAVTGVPYS